MSAATLSGPRADVSMTPAQRAARLLGWTSFGLAAAFLIAPKRIARTFNLEGKENLIRAFGVQEIVAGQGTLSVDPVVPMWSRAGGDVIHIATLASGLEGSRENGTRGNVLGGLALLGAFLVVDGLVAAALHNERRRGKGEARDYSDRSGFPQGVSAAKGVAADFETPPAYRAAPQQLPDERASVREAEAHPS